MDNNMNNNNEFANFFPIDEDEKEQTTGDEHNTKDTKHLSVLNVGQIIVFVILCTVICFQSIELFSYKHRNAIEPLQVNADYTQTNVYENSEYSSIEYTNVSADTDYYIADTNEIIAVSDPSNLSSETTPFESEVIFILGESEGRLAILSADGQIVYETFNVHINTLPPLDRDMLRDGIRITTTEELSSLLEDFSS